MTELWQENRQSLVQFLRIPLNMLDEILQGVAPSMAKPKLFTEILTETVIQVHEVSLKTLILAQNIVA